MLSLVSGSKERLVEVIWLLGRVPWMGGVGRSRVEPWSLVFNFIRSLFQHADARGVGGFLIRHRILFLSKSKLFHTHNASGDKGTFPENVFAPPARDRWPQSP